MGIHKKNYDTTYLPDAYAEVDPIITAMDYWDKGSDGSMAVSLLLKK